MIFEAETHEKIRVLKFTQERLDAAVASEFRSQLLSELDSGKDIYLLDLNIAEFIDSTGLGAIVAGLKAAKDRTRLVLCGIHGAKKELFRLTRLENVFEIVDDLQEIA